VSIQSYVGLLTIVAVRWPRWAVLVWLLMDAGAVLVLM